MTKIATTGSANKMITNTMTKAIIKVFGLCRTGNSAKTTSPAIPARTQKRLFDFGSSLRIQRHRYRGHGQNARTVTSLHRGLGTNNSVNITMIIQIANSTAQCTLGGAGYSGLYGLLIV